MGIDILTEPKNVASVSEIDSGTSDSVFITPKGLAGSVHGVARLGIAPFESDTSVTTGDGTVGIPVDSTLAGFDIVDVIAVVHTKGVTGTTDIQVRRRRAGSDVDVLSTKVTIGDEWYAADGVINTSNDDLAEGDALYVDVDAAHSGTAPLGLSVLIIAQLP